MTQKLTVSLIFSSTSSIIIINRQVPLNLLVVGVFLSIDKLGATGAFAIAAASLAAAAASSLALKAGFFAEEKIAVATA